MSNETESDIRGYVSDCFNHRGYKFDGETPDESAYQRLTKLMIEEYDLDHNDVDALAFEIEEMVARHIMENSPKFTDDDEETTA